MNMSIRFPHLGIELGYVGKTVSVFGFEITFYGILVAVGLLAGLVFIVLQAARQNQDQNVYLEALILTVLFGMISARICYVVMNWALFSQEPTRALWDIRTGGMSLCGGLLGGVIVLSVFCKIRKLSFGRMADIICIGMVISRMIGVWGNFFSREYTGGYTDSIFAMQIPSDVLGGRMTAQIQQNLTKVGDISYAQVHPLFAYESLWCLILLFSLLICMKRKKFQGEVFLRYLAGYGLGRAGIEFLRTDRICIPGTQISLFVPFLLGIFVIFTIVATVRRILSKKREKIRRHRTEKRYASEKKVSRSYGNMQSFENVSEEFRDILSGTSQQQQSETEDDILQKSNELPKTISDSEQTEDETK